MDDITGAIVDSAVALHRNPGPGLFESLYEALLFSDLRRRGFTSNVSGSFASRMTAPTSKMHFAPTCSSSSA
jgi:hypothetical protein